MSSTAALEAIMNRAVTRTTVDAQTGDAGDAVVEIYGDGVVSVAEGQVLKQFAARLKPEVRAYLEEATGVKLDAAPPAVVSKLERILIDAGALTGDAQMNKATDAVLEAMGINTTDTADDTVDASEVALFQKYACNLSSDTRRFVGESIGQAISCHSPSPTPVIVSPTPVVVSPTPVVVAPVIGSPEAAATANDAKEILSDLNNFRYRNFGYGNRTYWGSYYNVNEMLRVFTDASYAPHWADVIFNPTPSYRGLGREGLIMAVNESNQSLENALETVQDALDMKPNRAQMRAVRRELVELKNQPHTMGESVWDWNPIVLETSSEIRQIEKLIAEIDRLPRR